MAKNFFSLIFLIISVQSILFSQTYTGTKYPIQKGGPYDRVYYPENQPNEIDVEYFPQEWKFAYGSPQHNAAYGVSTDAPGWVKNGVSWKSPGARSWPLEEKKAFGTEVYGEALALSTITQSYGNAVGVAAVKGVIYSESDDMFAYAMNAKTGKLIWRTSPIGNNLMGNPIVVGDLVYISAGSVGFNFSNLSKYKKTDSASRGEGISYNGVYALNRITGELVWYFLTRGSAMTTPAYDNNRLYISTGDGFLYCIDATTGKKIWGTDLGGIANMSSPVIDKGMVYVSMSVKAFLYGVDAASGKVIWKGTIPDAANTGVGDVSPAVADGIVILDAVSDEKNENGKQTMNTTVRAFDAKTGNVLWTDSMGRGPKPPAFKGGVPMIHNGVAYTGSPVNSIYRAYDLKSGKALWTWNIPDAGPAGAGRGAPTYYKDVLYISTGPYLFAVNPKTGVMINKKEIGGRFGIVSPTIVGGNIYVGNSWDWIIAVPVKEVNPGYKADE